MTFAGIFESLIGRRQTEAEKLAAERQSAVEKYNALVSRAAADAPLKADTPSAVETIVAGVGKTVEGFLADVQRTRRIAELRSMISEAAPALDAAAHAAHEALTACKIIAQDAARAVVGKLDEARDADRDAREHSKKLDAAVNELATIDTRFNRADYAQADQRRTRDRLLITREVSEAVHLAGNAVAVAGTFVASGNRHAFDEAVRSAKLDHEPLAAAAG